MGNQYAVINLPINMIKPNPYQPRKMFDTLALEELSRSIIENGLLQPIVVRKVGDWYELILGERRLKASKLAGLQEIPAVITQMKSKESAMIAFTENVQRENLNFIEECECYQAVIDDFGYTHQELAMRLGKTKDEIIHKTQLYGLSDTVKRKLLQNNLNQNYAHLILQIPDETKQLEVINQIVQEEMGIKATELMVQEIANDMEIWHKNPRLKTFIKDVKLFTNTVEQAVELMQHSGVEIKYSMTEDDAGYKITIDIPTKK